MFSFLTLSATLVGAVLASPIALQPRAANPPTGLTEFQLKTLPITDNIQYGGWFPQLVHTTPNDGLAVLSADQNATITWQYESSSGDIYLTAGSNPFSSNVWTIGFSDIEPENSAPAGYKTVTIRSGYQASGFSFDGIELNNPAGRGTMAACAVDKTHPESLAGPQVQLLWRPDDVAISGCTDIKFQAIAVGAQ